MWKPSDHSYGPLEPAERATAMRRGRLPIRWLMLAVLLGTPALGGWAWWSRGRLLPDDLARGRAAYDRGDWDLAAGLARERLKGARDDPEGLRLLARAS